MSGKRLKKEHELSVLKKLSTDDDYRARYEKNPREALREIGVPDEHISSLDPASLKPGKLADKAEIAGAHKKLSDANISDQACLILPLLRLDYGDASGGKSA